MSTEYFQPHILTTTSDGTALPALGTVVLKGGTRLTVEEAGEALDQAMTIIEAVGTTGIYSRTQAAGEWLRKYYPAWA